jgi:hypothetical protein
MNWIAERAAEAVEADLRDVTLAQDNLFAKRKRIRPKEVNVHTAWLPVSSELEVMMLQI